MHRRPLPAAHRVLLRCAYENARVMSVFCVCQNLVSLSITRRQGTFGIFCFIFERFCIKFYCFLLSRHQDGCGNSDKHDSWIRAAKCQTTAQEINAALQTACLKIRQYLPLNEYFETIGMIVVRDEGINGIDYPLSDELLSLLE